MKKQNMKDSALLDAVEEFERGLRGADQGGNVFKKRLPAPGRGKSGGYRTLIMFNYGDRLIFAEGLAKKNLTSTLTDFKDEVVELQKRNAATYLRWSSEQIEAALTHNVLAEVKRNG